MSSNLPMKRLERMAYLSYHQDGLIDLFLGSAALGFGMQIAADSVIWNMFAWLPVIFYVPLKNRITVPRLGYVNFGTALGKNRRLIGLLILGLLLFLVVGLVFILPIVADMDAPWMSWIRSYPLFLFGMLGALGFVLAGVISGIGRLYTYALLCAAFLGVGQLIGVGLQFPILLLAAVFFAVGATLMIRFVRKYPLGGLEGSDEIG